MDQTPASLRLELFVRDVEAEADFFASVLGFERIATDQAEYVPLRLGDVIIALADIDGLPGGHPLRPSAAQERLGLGVEIVIEVDDVDAAFALAERSGYRLSGPLAERSWGLRDFRAVTPAGYYVRVTSR